MHLTSAVTLFLTRIITPLLKSGIDTSNENDDLLIGFKQIYNDFYAKDISRKVRAGLRQKQKNK